MHQLMNMPGHDHGAEGHEDHAGHDHAAHDESTALELNAQSLKNLGCPVTI